MSDRLWIAALLYPAPLYAGLLVLSHFAGNGVGVPLGFLLALGFGSATGFGLVRFPAWVWLGRFLLGMTVFVPLIATTGGGGAWLDLAAGVVIGSPFLWIEYAWHDDSSPAARAIALESVFVVGILCLAASSFATGGSGGLSFFDSLANVVVGQLNGIGDLLIGVVPNGLPLEASLDATFSALGGVALLGVILSGMSPRTALGEPLPWSWVRGRPAPGPVPSPETELGLRPGQREVLATRTLPISPDSVLPPGLGALIVTGFLLVGFVALAVWAPSYSLLVLVFAIVGALLAVAFVLSRRITPHGGLRA